MNETRRSLQVYLVEDSPIMQQSLGAAIAAAGAELIGCSADAETAIADVFVLEPDVVLIDIRLASGNGFDVLRALHQHSLAPGAVKVVLTNYAQTEYRKLSTRLGADRFFEKSVGLPQALALIDTMAAEKRATNAPRRRPAAALERIPGAA